MLLSLHTSAVISVMVVLRCWCGNMIGYKHTEIWQLWRDQEESREVQLTCQPREEGKGGCYSQYAVPGGEIHSQGDDWIWSQIDEKLSVVTNNEKTSPSQWSWCWQRSFIIKLHSWARLSPGDWFSSDKGTFCIKIKRRRLTTYNLDSKVILQSWNAYHSPTIMHHFASKISFK